MRVLTLKEMELVSGGSGSHKSRKTCGSTSTSSGKSASSGKCCNHTGSSNKSSSSGKRTGCGGPPPP
jgi:hypothetical protein